MNLRFTGVFWFLGFMGGVRKLLQCFNIGAISTSCGKSKADYNTTANLKLFVWGITHHLCSAAHFWTLDNYV